MWWNERMKQAFAHRLRKALDERRWSQSDLAREASKKIKGVEVTRDNISRYLRADSGPGAAKAEAIIAALGMKAPDLIPPRSVDPVLQATLPAEAAPMTLLDVGEGKFRMRFDRELPWETCQQILKLVQK